MQTLGFQQKINLLVWVHFETCDNNNSSTNVPVSAIVAAAHNMKCFSQEELLSMERALSQEKGTMRAGTETYVVQEGKVLGLRARGRPFRIKEVHEGNLDKVCTTYVSSEAVPESSRKRVREMHAEIVALREKRSVLHKRLSAKTFEVLCADSERYKKNKEREQLIEKARRQARRRERDALPPKLPFVPKRPRKPKLSATQKPTPF